jgi:hypothetical protein
LQSTFFGCIAGGTVIESQLNDGCRVFKKHSLIFRERNHGKQKSQQEKSAAYGRRQKAESSVRRGE